jgi:uncharacterized protein Yka (UPF0111/DUF47 family)
MQKLNQQNAEKTSLRTRHQRQPQQSRLFTTNLQNLGKMAKDLQLPSERLPQDKASFELLKKLERMEDYLKRQEPFCRKMKLQLLKNLLSKKKQN